MNKKLISIILLLLVLSFCTYKPLFNGKLFSVHDDTQPARVLQLANALKDSHIPVRWSKDLGYGLGYPLFNFYAPLPYYIGAGVYFISNNIVYSTLAMYLIGIIIAPISMYFLLKKIFGSLSAIVGSLIYTYAPYHAVEIFVRGAVGEYWAFGLMPLVILFLIKTYQHKSLFNITTGAMLYAALILSHNILAMIFTIMIIPLLLFVFIINWYNKNHLSSIKAVIVSILFGLLLSSFFWLPAISESSFTNIKAIVTGGSNYQDHYLYQDQLWDSPWGFAGSAPGRNDGMSFKIGKIQIFTGLLGILVFAYLIYSRQLKKNKIIGWSVVLYFLLVSVIMTLNVSLWLWLLADAALKYIQFPWRFIVFILLGLTLFSGFTTNMIKNKKIKLLFSVLIIILLIKTNSKYFNPQYYQNVSSDYYQSDSYYNKVSKISDEYLPQNFTKPGSSFLISRLIENTWIQYSINEEKTALVNFDIYTSEKTNLLINKTYFPSWQSYLDGKKVQYVNNSGRIAISTVSGLQNIILLNNGTITQIFSNSLSIFTMLLLVVLNIKYYSRLGKHNY